MSEDIQYAGSDTRPPILDRTDFESWQQRIRLYCLGKDNGENIMKSITEGPFQMGTFMETLSEGAEGALHIGPVYYVRFTKLINDMRNIKMTMPRMQLNSKFVNNMLPEWSRFITEVKLNKRLKESNFDQLYAYLKQHEVHANENRMMMERFAQPTNDPLALMDNTSTQENKATVQDGRVVIQDVRGRYNTNNERRPFQRNNARGSVGTRNAGGQNRGGNMNHGFRLLQGKDVTNFDDDVDDPPEQDLALNVEHIFKVDQCDAFDSDVDEAPTTHTMFMANLTSKDLIFDEAGASYDSDIPSEVQDHDNYQDSVYGHHDVHEMQNNIQQDYVVDSDADYTSDSNLIPYDQYVEDNAEHVVQSNVSYVQNDALMSIIDEMHEQGVQSRSTKETV
ncbi:hypothetical protein Tco_0435660 [Tanacetum coccineum]